MPRTSPTVLQVDAGTGYAVQKIQQTHHEMIRLAALGLHQRDIAQITGRTPQNVHDVLSSPIVQRRLEMLQAQADGATIDVMEALQEDAVRSLELLQEVRDAPDAPIKLRVQVACDLLSRAGYGRVQKVQAAVAHGFLTSEKIEEIKARARNHNSIEEPLVVEFQEIAA